LNKNGLQSLKELKQKKILMFFDKIREKNTWTVI
jgi:hypothetical protein